MTKPVCPAKTQISLGIRPVWSESSLSTWRRFRRLATHKALRQDSDQTVQMPRLIWIFAGAQIILFVLYDRKTCWLIWVFVAQLTYDIYVIPLFSPGVQDFVMERNQNLLDNLWSQHILPVYSPPAQPVLCTNLAAHRSQTNRATYKTSE